MNETFAGAIQVPTSSGVMKNIEFRIRLPQDAPRDGRKRVELAKAETDARLAAANRVLNVGTLGYQDELLLRLDSPNNPRLIGNALAHAKALARHGYLAVNWAIAKLLMGGDVAEFGTNALTALHSGVTTIRDCGGKGTLMFQLRDAIRRGIVPGPRFVLSGRPLTITGGHCRYFGGEVDGVDEMRLAARQLLKEGADFIKIMASGGGTVGTYSQYPAFDVDEMRAAIHEAHKIGKRASCHCIAQGSIANALDAGTDHIEHCSFMAPDTTQHYDEQLAQRVASQGVYVTPTLQVMRKGRMGEGNISVIRNLHELGVPLVAGNDAGWLSTGFGDFYRELQCLEECGLTPLEAIHAATGRAADACQLRGVVGTVAPGCIADLLVVKGDPTSDLGVLADPLMVLQAGRVIVDRRN